MPLADHPSTVQFKDPTITRWAAGVVAALRAIINFLEPWRKPEPWKLLPLHGNWSALRGSGGTYKTAWFDPAFTKDPNGIVRLRGVALSAASASDSVIGQLPDKYRPAQSMIFSTIGAANVTCRIDIDQDGKVYYAAGTANPAYVTLDGITFDTRGQNNGT